MSDALRHFAEQARMLELDLNTLEHATPETLKTFAQTVLEELTALGHLPDLQPGCYTDYAGRSGDA